MKTHTLLHRAVLVALLSLGLAPAQAENVAGEARREEAGWLNPFVVRKKTQTVDRNAAGDEDKVTVVTESKVSVTRLVTEVSQPDTNGNLRVTSRTVQISDTLLTNKLIVQERLLTEGRDLVVTSITEERRMPDGTGHMVVQERDEHGAMVEKKVAYTYRDDDGTLLTVVEARDAATGGLRLKQTASERRTVGLP